MQKQNYLLWINGLNQSLLVYKNKALIRNYNISTAKNGFGEEWNSEKTPRGWHIIRAKIGAACAENTIFIKRRPTGEIYTSELAKQYPERDWVLTRILWLSGTEKYINRLANVDSMRRKIYIHGTPDSSIVGKPGSRGCIRMLNNDLIELFDLIPIYTRVLITANGECLSL